MELRDLYKYTPWYFYGKAFKSLAELIGNKRFIKFAILGLPQSGKTHFISIVRKEPFDSTKQTPWQGVTLERKSVELDGKTLVFERSHDINGLNLTQYAELIERSDIIYFFFRADYYLSNAGRDKMEKEGFPEEEIKRFKTYREMVFAYFGSVIRDKNAKGKPIQIIASYRKEVKNIKDSTVTASIRNGFKSNFPDADFENCAFSIADIDDKHRDWVENKVKELIFNK